jgi:hypothetical protein
MYTLKSGDGVLQDAVNKRKEMAHFPIAKYFPSSGD